MSRLDSKQLEVAGLLFALPEADGFALAGGCALLALDAIDRPTRDIDAFIAAIRSDAALPAAATGRPRRRSGIAECAS